MSYGGSEIDLPANVGQRVHQVLLVAGCAGTYMYLFWHSHCTTAKEGCQ